MGEQARMRVHTHMNSVYGEHRRTIYGEQTEHRKIKKEVQIVQNVQLMVSICASQKKNYEIPNTRNTRNARNTYGYFLYPVAFFHLKKRNKKIKKILRNTRKARNPRNPISGVIILWYEPCSSYLWRDKRLAMTF